MQRGTYVITHTYQSSKHVWVNPSHKYETLKAGWAKLSAMTTTFVLRTAANEHELPPDSTDYRSLGLTTRSLEPHNHPQLVSNQFTASSTPKDPHSLPLAVHFMHTYTLNLVTNHSHPAPEK